MTPFPIKSISLPLIAAGLLIVPGCDSGEVVEPGEPATAAVRVQPVAVVQKEIQHSTRQPATVRGYYETEIRSRAAGYAKSVQVDIGDVVEEGQLLAEIAVPETEKRREVAQANVQLLEAQARAAEAGVALAEAAVRANRAKLEQTRSQLEEQAAELAAAEAEFERTQDLVSRGTLQERLLDEATKKRDAAKAGKSAIESAVQSAAAEVAVAEAEMVAAEANLRSAISSVEVSRKELEEIEVRLSFAELRAPFKGIVTMRQLELGDLVIGQATASSEALFVVAAIDRVRVQIHVPEREAPFVQVGDEMTLRFPAFAEEPELKIPVTRIGGSVYPETRTMLVEAEVENGDGKLLPGMFGDAEISLQADLLANVLPARAIRFDSEGAAFVYLIDGDNTVRTVDVVLGQDDGEEIEVIAGLEAGQIVIGPHLDRFSDGQQVEPL